MGFRRLRNKLIVLMLGVLLTGILGTAWVAGSAFLADKRDTVMELISSATPNVAASIGKQLDALDDQLALFDEILRSTEDSGRIGSLLKTAFKKLKGVERLDIFDRRGLVASIHGEGAWKGEEPDLSSLKPSGQRRLALGGKGTAIFSVRVKDHSYFAFLSHDAFTESLDQSHAIAVSLVTDDGKVLVGAQPLSRSAAAFRPGAGEEVVTREAKGDRGERILSAVSTVPGSGGAAVVAQVPLARVSEMATQVLGGALPFLAVIVVFATFLGVVFSGSLTKPIEALTTATARIASGDWNVRLEAGGRDEIGALVGAFSTMGDELAKREAALEKAHDDLLRSERLATLGQFSAGLAHEVKNPLNSILGFAQLLEKRWTAEGRAKGERDETERKYLAYILDETRRASRIITDLLGFARQKAPILARHDLRAVLERSIDLFKPVADSTGVTLKLDAGPGSYETQVDRDQIHQVLLNLMTNAGHAMQENAEGRPRVLTLSLRRQSGAKTGFRIEVRDTGSGISPENLKRLFEPFFTTKGVGKGTGLGLALCHGIVHAHGGRIDVESKEGEGTAFSIDLPAAAP